MEAVNYCALRTELGGDRCIHFSQNHDHQSTGLRLTWKSKYLKSLVIPEGKGNLVRITDCASSL